MMKKVNRIKRLSSSNTIRSILKQYGLHLCIYMMTTMMVLYKQLRSIGSAVLHDLRVRQVPRQATLSSSEAIREVGTVVARVQHHRATRAYEHGSSSRDDLGLGLDAGRYRGSEACSPGTIEASTIHWNSEYVQF